MEIVIVALLALILLVSVANLALTMRRRHGGAQADHRSEYVKRQEAREKRRAEIRKGSG